MKIIKTCLFETVNIIKLAKKAHLLPNYLKMGRSCNLVAATLTVTAFATSPAVAEDSKIATHDTISCETKVACQQLTETIQSQISALKAKGLRNLSKPERLEFVKLRKQLIALEKQETEKNSNLIATEKSETQDQNSKIEIKLKAQDKQIAGLRGALLEK